MIDDKCMKKKTPQDLGVCGFLLARDFKNCFTQIYKDWYEDAVLVPFREAPTCGRKVTETSVIEFYYLNKILSI